MNGCNFTVYCYVDALRCWQGVDCHSSCCALRATAAATRWRGGSFDVIYVDHLRASLRDHFDPGSGDYYDIVGFRVASIPPLLGDVNGDWEVDHLDVVPFIDHLLNGPFRLEADMNEDGALDGRDVAPFVAAVQASGSAQAIPEPPTFWLTVLALLGSVAYSWRQRTQPA